MSAEKIISIDQEEEAGTETLEVFTIKLKKPVEYNGTSYEELHFNFNKLTGRDCLAIENELSMLGKNFVTPEISGEYLTRFAARALEEPVGADFIQSLPAAVYSRIRARARTFLLLSA